MLIPIHPIDDEKLTWWMVIMFFIITIDNVVDGNQKSPWSPVDTVGSWNPPYLRRVSAPSNRRFSKSLRFLVANKQPENSLRPEGVPLRRRSPSQATECFMRGLLNIRHFTVMQWFFCLTFYLWTLFFWKQVYNPWFKKTPFIFV